MNDPLGCVCQIVVCVGDVGKDVDPVLFDEQVQEFEEGFFCIRFERFPDQRLALRLGKFRVLEGGARSGFCSYAS